MRRRYADNCDDLVLRETLLMVTVQHSSGNKQAEEDADKDTEKKLEEIKKIGKDTGPKVSPSRS